MYLLPLHIPFTQKLVAESPQHGHCSGPSFLRLLLPWNRQCPTHQAGGLSSCPLPLQRLECHFICFMSSAPQDLADVQGKHIPSQCPTSSLLGGIQQLPEAGEWGCRLETRLSTKHLSTPNISFPTTLFKPSEKTSLSHLAST